MKTFEVKVKMKVADSWVADGFNLGERLNDIREQFEAMLPYAYEHEVLVDVVLTKSPKDEVLHALQSGDAPIKD